MSCPYCNVPLGVILKPVPRVLGKPLKHHAIMHIGMRGRRLRLCVSEPDSKVIPEGVVETFGMWGVEVRLSAPHPGKRRSTRDRQPPETLDAKWSELQGLNDCGTLVR